MTKNVADNYVAWKEVHLGNLEKKSAEISEEIGNEKKEGTLELEWEWGEMYSKTTMNLNEFVHCFDLNKREYIREWMNGGGESIGKMEMERWHGCKEEMLFIWRRNGKDGFLGFGFPQINYGFC